MKKLWIAIAVVAVVFVAGLGAASSVAYAQAGNPPTVDGTVSPLGGMMGNHWGGQQAMIGSGTEVLHDLTIDAWATELGLSVDELNAKMAEGFTLAEIAAEQGITGEAFTTLWAEVRFSVLDEAVAQGLITSEQAQIMKDRLQARLDSGWIMNAGMADCTQDGTGTPRMGGMGMSRGTQGGMRGGGNR